MLQNLLTVMIVVTILSLLPFYDAFAQKSSLSEMSLRFMPEVPTERSSITAIISIAAPTPCHEVALQDYELSEKNLSINVEIIPPPPDRICIFVIKEHTLMQEIGMLPAGAYDARLFINGEEKGSTRLYVTANDFAILSSSQYRDGQGGFNLVGEVKNTGDKPAERVRVDISFFEGDELLKEEKIFTTMAIILPNGTSGFSMPLLDENLQDKEYSVRITSYDGTAPVEKALSMIVEPRIEEGGVPNVIGSVANGSGRNATQVKVVCVLYDLEDGALLDSVFGYTDPASIPPGLVAQFEISPHREIEREFTASCNAESEADRLALQQVQVVPEFPLAAITTAIAVTTLLAGLAINNRFRNKL